MNHLLRKLLMLALVVALPSLGCFSYYTFENAEQRSSIPPFATLVAYPALLISLAGVLTCRFSARRFDIGVWIFGAVLAASLTILLWARS